MQSNKTLLFFFLRIYSDMFRPLEAIFILRHCIYSRVSFYNGSFYDDSLLRPLFSRTKHSPHSWYITAVTQVSFLYIVRFWLFSGVHVFLLFLFQCSSFKLIVIFPPMTSIKKTEKKKKSKQLTLHSFLMSSEPRPGFFQQNKK